MRLPVQWRARAELSELNLQTNARAFSAGGNCASTCQGSAGCLSALIFFPEGHNSSFRSCSTCSSIRGSLKPARILFVACGRDCRNVRQASSARTNARAQRPPSSSVEWHAKAAVTGGALRICTPALAPLTDHQAGSLCPCK